MSAQQPDVDLYDRVCRRLGVRSDQTINDRAKEIRELVKCPGSGVTNGQEQMAIILLDRSLEPWESMRRADAVPCVEIVR